MNILVINAGSSSLKYQLLNPDTQEVLAKGLCERIGLDGKFTYKPAGKEAVKDADVSMPTHSEAIQTVLNALVDPKNGVIGSMKEIDAVGHRVVHGGEKFAQSVLITDEVMAAIEECNPLAPLHNPANLMGIEVAEKLFPGVPNVAVFDTEFGMAMPQEHVRPALRDLRRDAHPPLRLPRHLSQVHRQEDRRIPGQAPVRAALHHHAPRQRLFHELCERRQVL